MSVCLECSKKQDTCCQKYFIYLTHGDRERIIHHTRSTDFLSEIPCTLNIEEHLTTGKSKVTCSLIKMEDHGCFFLSANGCSLPLDVRPLCCRIYPYTWDRSSINGVSEECFYSDNEWFILSHFPLKKAVEYHAMFVKEYKEMEALCRTNKNKMRPKS